jgi:integrase
MFHRRKKGNKWYVSWRENGKQREKAVSSDLQIVKKFELQLANRLESQKNGVVISNVTFEDLCYEYIEDYSKIYKRERSVERDYLIIKNFKKSCPNIKFVKQFTDTVLEDFKVIRKKAGISEATINRELGTLKNMMKFAYKKKYLDTDYFSNVQKFKITNGVKKFILEEKYIEKLIKNTSHPYKTAFVLALYAGLRRGEVCNLEWNDIDFENNLIDIKPKMHLKWSPKTNTSIRKAPIHPYLKEYLLDLKKISNDKTSFVCFYKERFNRLNEQVLTHYVIRIKASLGLPKEFCFHSLRHTFVSKMAEFGVPTYHISKIIGHSNTNITEQVYTHLKDTSFFKSIEKLEY